MPRLLLLVTAALTLSLGCSAPLDAPTDEPDPAPAMACTVAGVSLLDLAHAYERADLVVTTRTLRVLPASPFVQSPPVPGDTVRYVVAGEVTAVAHGPGTLGERIDYQFTAPFTAGWEKTWAEGSEWMTWLEPREGRVPWQTVRAPIAVTDTVRALLANDQDAWPSAGLHFSPNVTVETVTGGVSTASGFLFLFKTARGETVRLRLTDIDAAEPALWALAQGSEVWEQITPCSITGARLYLALPQSDSAHLTSPDAREAFDRLVTLLGSTLEA